MNARLAVRKRGLCRLISAYSFMEVLVAMAVLGVVLVGLLASFTSGIFQMRMARENLRATQVMLEKVETIRLYGWDQLTTPESIGNTFTADYDPNSANKGIRYSGTLTWNPVPLTVPYANQMTQLTVRVSWRTGGLDRSRTFTTYVARQGLANYSF